MIDEKLLKQLITREHGKSIRFQAVSDEQGVPPTHGVAVGLPKEKFLSGTEIRQAVIDHFKKAGFVRANNQLALPVATHAEAEKAAGWLNNPNISMTAVVTLEKKKMLLKKQLEKLADSITPEQKKDALAAREQEGAQEAAGETMIFSDDAFINAKKSAGYGRFTDITDPRLLDIAHSYEKLKLDTMATSLGCSEEQGQHIDILTTDHPRYNGICFTPQQLPLYAEAMKNAFDIQTRERQIQKAGVGQALREGKTVCADVEIGEGNDKPRKKKKMFTQDYLDSLKHDTNNRGRP